uniref:Uncharacterized protein n=1 Tax=Noccaea caerulescens TaxID=107243 RepID=A0A1J3FUB1_NOCCA
MVAPFKALENIDMSLEELYSHVGITGKSNSIKKDPLSNSGVSETLLAVRIPACVANSSRPNQPKRLRRYCEQKLRLHDHRDPPRRLGRTSGERNVVDESQ